MSLLAGRRALVTGAGSGIGRAIAIGLGDAGADVVLAGRRPEPLQEAAEHVRAQGVKAAAVPADVRDPDQVRELIEATRAELGGIDALVHAAGVHSLARSLELGEEELTDVIETNLIGAFRVAREVGRAML